MEQDMKLTSAQREYLELLSEAGKDGRPTWNNYRPAKKLVDLKLARWQSRSMSAPLCIITDDGRALIAEWSKE